MSMLKTLTCGCVIAALFGGTAVAQSTGSSSYTIKRTTTADGQVRSQNLTPSTDHLARMFKQFDVNGDGYIDVKEEMRGRTQRADGGQARSGGLIAFLDKDRDQRVSFAEFKNTGMPK